MTAAVDSRKIRPPSRVLCFSLIVSWYCLLQSCSAFIPHPPAASPSKVVHVMNNAAHHHRHKATSNSNEPNHHDNKSSNKVVDIIRSFQMIPFRFLFLALAPSLSLTSSPTLVTAAEPTTQQIDSIKRGFRAFEAKDLVQAERLFDKAVTEWEELERPRDEIASLIKVRGEVRCDLKKFDAALQDYNRVLDMMASDGVRPDGTAAYSEYPDTFVQRGLAYEGLSDWQAAVNDYSRAIQLWGGGRGEGINPFVLVFRGNSLQKLDRYQDSLPDYQAAADMFLSARDDDNANAARANYALALYQVGKTESDMEEMKHARLIMTLVNEMENTLSVKIMKDIIRRAPGFADMHVALAAHSWGEGDLGVAESEWRFTCENISVGCRQYRDLDWVSRIRRWPPKLVQRLADFLQQSNLGSK